MKKSLIRKQSNSRLLGLETLESRELLSITTAELAPVVEIASSNVMSEKTIDVSILEAAVPETPSTVVTSLLDVVNATDGVVTLREAISYANPSETITFSPALAGGTITLSGSQLEIAKAISIDASALWNAQNNAPGITIDANQLSRVFTISELEGSQSISLVGLKITRGFVDNNENGELLNSGGGILNQGTLNVTNSQIANNSATNGGGILNLGTLNVTNSQIANNSATNGGGIFNSKKLEIINTVVTDNNSGKGGGIYNNSAATLDMLNCTVVKNECFRNGGGIYSENNFTARNSIIVINRLYEPNPSSQYDVFIAPDSNVIGANNISTFTDWIGDNNLKYQAGLSLFVNSYEGDYRLVKRSPAINGGANEFVTTNRDPDGNERINQEVVDIGAYEFTPSTEPSIIVNSLLDVIDPNDGVVTLREAIMAIELDEIVGFDASLAGGTITLSGSSLNVSTPFVLDASNLYDTKNNRPRITIDAAAKSSVFAVNCGQKNYPFVLKGITIQNGNAGEGCGGGIENYIGAVSAIDCTFVGNSALNGGAVFNYGVFVDDLFRAFFSATNCVFIDNTAINGGAILNGYGNVEIVNCLLTGNTADFGGAINVVNDGATLDVTNTTITGNAAGIGGGICLAPRDVSGVTLNVKNSIVALNSGNSGADVFNNPTAPGTINGSNNLSSYVAWIGSNNLAYDETRPLFVDAQSGDYSLAHNSQAINKGSDAYVTTKTDLEGKPRVQLGCVDVGAYEYEVIAFDYAPAPRVATISWNAIPSAASYTVQVSRNGGATWANLNRGLDATSTTDRGFYAGSSRCYRVFGFSADGKLLAATREGTFAPVVASVSCDAFKQGDTINLTIKAAENASYDVRWYEVAPDGDVEISAAAGNLSYTPANTNFPIKVVVTGNGVSEGAGAEFVVSNELTVGNVTIDHYNSGSHQAIITWDEIPNSDAYNVKLSKDGGASWVNYRTNIQKLTVPINGVYPGKSYMFRVYGVQNGTTRSSFNEGTIEPVKLAYSETPYVVRSSKKINLLAANPENVELRWYNVTDNGLVEIGSALNQTSYKPLDGNYELRVIATGIAGTPCAGFSSELSIARPIGAISFSNVVVGANVSSATATWNALPGAVSYTIRYSRDDGATWLRKAKDVTDVTRRLSMLNAGDQFRVFGVDANGKEMKSIAQGTLNVGSNALVDEVFADFFAKDELFEEF